MDAKSVVVLVLAFIVGFQLYSKSKRRSALIKDAITHDMKNNAKDSFDHLNMFNEPRIITVTEGVYVAIGFALGNSILVEGTDGVIIVDTTESAPAMDDIMKEFRKITKKPVKAVIVTHFHTDHVEGTKTIFHNEGRHDINVYGHKLTVEEMNQDPNTEIAFFVRANRQFGMALNRDDRKLGGGIGINVKLSNYTKWGVVRPNIVYEDRATYIVAGLTFELIHTPGETPDQTSVWFPDLRLYLPADNIYQCFPNLYAIRGSPPRDAKVWYESIDIGRELRPKYLAPSHTLPLSGEEVIYDVLTVYRDAIKFVHDQTVRYADKGWHPSEIADHIRLPKSIRDHIYLRQYYGTVEWSVRGVFDQYLGWFSGDPADLSSLSNKKRSRRLALLMGRNDDGSESTKINSGITKMLKEALDAVEASQENLKQHGRPLCEEDKWAMELTRDAKNAAHEGSDLHAEAVAIQIKALYSLHLCNPSANGRNYFLTSAMELQGKVTPTLPKHLECNTIKASPLGKLFKAMALRLDDEKCDVHNVTAIWKFTDDGANPKHVALNIRNCVCDVIEEPDDKVLSSSTFVVSMTTYTLRAMFCNDVTGAGAYLRGDLVMEKGGITDLGFFIGLFDLSK